MVNTFNVPADGSIYAETIFERCRDLIGYQIWSGLQRSRLDAWVANFQTAEERYFAARVLDALIYRSDDQTIALLRHLLCRVVPDYARIGGLPASLRQVYYSLRDPKIDPRVRVVPVIPPGAPPTKSGPLIARHLKRALKISERWIIHPERVAHEVSSIDAVIFVDDFLGTGHQFGQFLADTGLSTYLTSSCFLYACLAGHKHGIDTLRRAFPDLHVATVENLDDSHAVFHAESGSFPDGVNSIETAKDFYYDLLDDRGITIVGQDRRGYGHLEIAYAFEHAVPDNSLPILWWDQSDSWNPLFDR
ncbi:MAG: hypothetical protein KDB27_28205 [Planctomycetales bacterium]|nr:hypothetical protein [Planctomycetales bacterium]